jgi:hypothetical protein
MMRDEMRAACAAETVAFERQCGGRVRLTPEHLEAAGGNRDTILVEARIGCSQKCGCMEAAAQFESHDGVEYVVTRCRSNPSAAFLGHRVEPDPGRTK